MNYSQASRKLSSEWPNWGSITRAAWIKLAVLTVWYCLSMPSFSGEGKRQVMRDGLKRILTRSALGRQLIALRSRFRAGIHRRKMRHFYSQFIAPGNLCYDVGANVGDRTDIFRKLGARVIAIEPQTACLEVLRQRFGL